MEEVEISDSHDSEIAGVALVSVVSRSVAGACRLVSLFVGRLLGRSVGLSLGWSVSWSVC